MRCIGKREALTVLSQAESRWSNEPNYGKAIVECEESLSLETVERSEIQVLIRVNRHHNYTLGIREGSADRDMKGYHSR
jgi:hypothetical protein